MVQVKLTPDQFTKKLAEVSQKVGSVLSADSGKISHFGFEGTYHYDGTTLTVIVTNHPFFMSIPNCESHLTDWFKS